MLCTAIAFITSKRIYPESIYSEWLARRGEKIDHGRDVTILERITVGEVYDRDPDVIREDATVHQILAAIENSSQTEFPVLDEEDRLVGMLAYNDLRTVLSQMDSLRGVLVAADIANEETEPVAPTDSLRTALRHLSVHGSHAVPVVAPGDSRKLVGMVGRQEIFNAYDRELLKQH
jgi:CIC family chloride channel protein